jgi:hypothetical protein
VGQKYVIDAYTYTPNKKLKNLKDAHNDIYCKLSKISKHYLGGFDTNYIIFRNVEIFPPKNLMKFFFGRKNMESFFIFYFSK